MRPKVKPIPAKKVFAEAKAKRSSKFDARKRILRASRKDHKLAIAFVRELLKVDDERIRALEKKVEDVAKNVDSIIDGFRMANEESRRRTREWLKRNPL